MSGPDHHPTNRWIRVVGLVVVMGLAATWLALEFASERAVDVAAGQPARSIPIRDDFSVIESPARQMLRGETSHGNSLDYRYPAITSAMYAPLTVLPTDQLYVVIRVAGGAYGNLFDRYIVIDPAMHSSRICLAWWCAPCAMCRRASRTVHSNRVRESAFR